MTDRDQTLVPAVLAVVHHRLPASAVVASLYTVSLAVRTTDSLVVSSDDGMDVVAERHLAAEAVARNLGIAAESTSTPKAARSWPP